jgi:hypothetical protein
MGCKCNKKNRTLRQSVIRRAANRQIIGRPKVYVKPWRPAKIFL